MNNQVQAENLTTYAERFLGMCLAVSLTLGINPKNFIFQLIAVL